MTCERLNKVTEAGCEDVWEGCDQQREQQVQRPWGRGGHVVDSENLGSQKSILLFNVYFPDFSVSTAFYFDVLTDSREYPMTPLSLLPNFSVMCMSLQCLTTQSVHFGFHAITALKCQTLFFVPQLSQNLCLI